MCLYKRVFATFTLKIKSNLYVQSTNYYSLLMTTIKTSLITIHTTYLCIVQISDSAHLSVNGPGNIPLKPVSHDVP